MSDLSSLNHPFDVSDDTSLTIDLHRALQEVPLDLEYAEKLEMYSEKLTKVYNWRKVTVYNTIEELEELPLGSKVTDSANAVGVKHLTGWVLIDNNGYAFTHMSANSLSLPVYSIPNNIGLQNDPQTS